MPLTLQGLFRFMRAERGGGGNTQMRSRKHTITVKTAHPSFPRFDSETEMEGAVSTPLTLHTHKGLLHREHN